MSSRVRRSLIAFALLAAVAASGLPTAPTAVADASTGPSTLTPIGDATVDEARPNQRHGSASTLLVEGKHKGDADYWTYLRFDLGADTAPISKATLRLYVVDSSPHRPTVARTSGDWNEAEITWSNRPAATGSTVTTADRAARRAWLEFDVLPLLPPSGEVDLVMRPTGANGVDFSSRTGVHAPELVVERAPSGSAPTATTTPTAEPAATPVPTATATATPTAAPTAAPTATPTAAPTATPKATATATPTPTPVRTAAPTAPSAAGTVVLAGGDVCNSGVKANSQRTGDIVRSMPNAPVLALGDLQYPDGTLSSFKSCYDETWGSFKARTKPIPGNHEYHTSGAAGYFDYFGSIAGERGKGYYSFTIDANWIGVALNSELSGSAMSTQVTWLSGVLDANASKHVVAYMHKPRFSSGDHGNTSSVRPLWDVLYAKGADLVLAGHDHNYERFEPMRPDGTSDPQGIRSFVVGTGGTNLRSMSSSVSGSEASTSSAWGVLKLTLKPSGYDWQFVPAQGSSYADAGAGAVVDGALAR